MSGKKLSLINNFLSNKYVLYLVFLAALFEILSLLAMEDYDSLGLFMVIGLLASYFTKNMIIVLIVAMAFTNCRICSTLLIRNNIIEGNTSKTAAKVDPKTAGPDDTEGDPVVEYNPKSYFWWDPNGGGAGKKRCKEAKDMIKNKGGKTLCGEECYNDIVCDKQNCIGKDCPEKDPAQPDGTV